MARHDSTPAAANQQPDSDGTPFNQLPDEVKAVVRRWLGRAKAAGHWFPVFDPMFRILPKLDALFLCRLMNLQSMKKTVVGSDGYFLCTNRWMERYNWSVNEQKQRWAALVATGLVRVERRGLPPTRWVFIDLIEIERRLDAAGCDYIESDDGWDEPDPPDDQSSGIPTINRQPPQSSGIPTNGRRPTRRSSVNEPDAMKGIPNGIPAKDMNEKGEPASRGARPDSDFRQTQTPASAAPRAPVWTPPPVRSCWDDDDPEPTPRQMPATGAPSPEVISRPVDPGPVRNGAPAQSQKPITPPTPQRRPAPEPQEDELGAFFGSADTKTTRQDGGRAARLRAHAHDMGWRPSGTRNDWGPEFGILRREREKAGDTPDWIDRVLDKYITKRINKPTIKSGKELRTNWDWVLRETGLDKPPRPEVTPAARKVADRVLGRAWPFPDDDVYALAQMSMDAINSFWDRLDAFPKPINPRTGEPPRMFGALNGLLGELSFQTQKHLSDTAENLSSWQGGYRGGVDSLVWAPDKHGFAADAERVCRDWQWKGGWPALLAAINDNWVAKGGK